MKLSIIIPVHNEAENIADVYQELCDLNLSPEYEIEIVIVDDSSIDNTRRVLDEIKSSADNVTVVCHPQRLGQSAAIATGISVTDGQIIATLDGDGQNVAQDIPILLLELCPQTACVNGIRSQRNDPRFKVFSSKIANRVRRWLLNDPIVDAGCALKLFRRDALFGLPYFDGMHRFLPSILHMQGYAIKQVQVRQRPRKCGNSKYGVSNRLGKGMLDCMAMIWYRRYCFNHIEMSNNANVNMSISGSSVSPSTEQCDSRNV